jgi:hypothetical protein
MANPISRQRARWNALRPQAGQLGLRPISGTTGGFSFFFIWFFFGFCFLSRIFAGSVGFCYF